MIRRPRAPAWMRRSPARPTPSSAVSLRRPIPEPFRSPTTRPSPTSPTGRPRPTASPGEGRSPRRCWPSARTAASTSPSPGHTRAPSRGNGGRRRRGSGPPLLPYWGKVTPFVMTSPSQFRAPPPEALGSKEYAEELAFVASHGARDDADRTEYQTLCTPFWSDDLGTATPAGPLERHRPGHRPPPEPLRAGMRAALRAPQPGRGGRRDLVLGDKVLLQLLAPGERPSRTRPKAQPARRRRSPTSSPTWRRLPFPSYISGHSTYSSAAGAR